MTAARVSLARLKQLAEAATPDGNLTLLEVWRREGERWTGERRISDGDIAFYAAANPATVAALCDALRMLHGLPGVALEADAILTRFGIELEDRRP